MLMLLSILSNGLVEMILELLTNYDAKTIFFVFLTHTHKHKDSLEKGNVDLLA